MDSKAIIFSCKHHELNIDDVLGTFENTECCYSYQLIKIFSQVLVLF